KGSLLIDGEEITGEYLMVEVLNTKAVGPRLSLAPDADPNDGFFDIVCVKNDERTHFLRYVTGLLTQGFDKVPNVQRYSGKRLEFVWKGFPIHVDAEIHPQTNGNGPTSAEIQAAIDEEATIIFELLPHSLELWLPPGIN